uniref:Uncharacterized protein n=1 Tax=Gossypium raimondii TaxID=29730 RepID=A0A0D2RYN3_GOSRA|nr:hypothetical protein B456_006G187000 [Gossypium raimondii]
MPGPGPHLMYAMSSGLALTHLTRGRFSPHHTLTYTLNAFFGPDIGSFSEWLTSVLFLDSSVLAFLADSIHHPVYYVLILGLPLCLFYSWASGILVKRSLLDSVSGENVGFLCTCLIGGFIYINRVGLPKSTRKQSYQSMKLIMIIASLYSFWCASQTYWANPRRPAVGEEADLGVLVFLATYFLLPHGLCILSMNSEDLHTDHIPL